MVGNTPMRSRFRAVDGHSISTLPAHPADHCRKLLHAHTSGLSTESSLHWTAMDIAQFLCSLPLGPHRKIAVANLPEATLVFRFQLVRRDLPKHLDCHGEFPSFRFADEQMDMLGHGYISGNEASVPDADAL